MNTNLNDCGCCEGLTLETPVAIDNRAGLTAIAYRVGTYSRFRTSMLARLSDADLAKLKKLMTREDDDFSIALLDAWASVADVLSFYQERIANEAYLRTATERASVLQLARVIGYEQRPGVAASTYLAFTLEDAQGAPKRATIDIGTKVQSVPGPGEQPQTFETVEKIDARAEWNALKPQASTLILPQMGDTSTYLKGVTTNLKPGDALLFNGAGREDDSKSDEWDFRTVQKVIPDSTTGITHVTWAEKLSHIKLPVASAAQPKVYALRQRAALFGYNAPDWRAMTREVRNRYMPPITSIPPPPADEAKYSPDDGGSSDSVEWPGLSISSISYPSSSPDGDGTGLSGEYYDNFDFTNLKISRIDQTLNFNWTNSAPDSSMRGDKFAVRWIGQVKPKFSESYTFRTRSDDGVRLWVNNQLIIDHWTNHPPKDDNSTPIALKEGEKYDIKLEYFQGVGWATLQLFWKSPSQSEEIIPQAHLYPPDTIHLSASYPQILAKSWLVLSIPTFKEVYQVLAADEDSRKGFTISGKTTRVRLQGENLIEIFNNSVREIEVFGQSEQLQFAETPLTTIPKDAPSASIKPDEGMLAPIEGDQIALAQFVTGLENGRTLIVSGKLMRVKIVSAPNAKEIVPDQSWQAFNLNVNDSLRVIESPVSQTDGRVQLHLMDKDGFTAIVTTDPTNVQLTPALKDDPIVSENVGLDKVGGNGQVLEFSLGLKSSYDRATVVIYANVALATNGETKTEVLGSGDASQPYQQFTLKQSRLTYISAETPSGADSTLKIYVNDVQWHEQPELYNANSHDRVFVTRTSDPSTSSGLASETTVEFGDGRTGARVPSGRENIKATYRKGIGTSGNIKAGQLSLLMASPLGIKSVTNPQPASGGDDPEKLDNARMNAPITVLTLDRIVSLRDYEDFARAFAGIAKARATWTSDGQTRGVFVTVAGPKGAAIPAGSKPMTNLIAAMQDAGNPHVPLRVETYRRALFRLFALVDINPDYLPDKVVAAVTQALRDEFSFDARVFGQDVALSEVVALIQAVPGVVAVDVTKLYRVGDPQIWNARLPAALPLAGTQKVMAAELLTLDPGPIDLGVM